MISDALAYPLRGTGKYILVIGAILSLLLSVGAYVPVLGLILVIGASGFFSAYMFKVINATTCGHDEPCDWPDFQDFFSDLVVPWLCILSASFFSFGPYAVVSSMSEEKGLLSMLLLILGFVHFPMSILCVAICGTMRSAFWWITLPLISRCLPQYIVLVLVFGGLSIINVLLKGVLSFVPFLGWFISFFLGMYSLMVTGRLIGLFNRENSHLLG
jgi:hypothetical protein